MKYALIIADGAGDKPLDELGGQTPLQVARTPNMDRLAQMGRLGTARTTPPGWLAGSDVCTMCLLGYDPVKYHTGRAPLEAAALKIPMGEKDWIFRLNLVTVGEEGTPDAGLMLDHSAGAISDAEARQLVHGLRAFIRAREPGLSASMVLTAGVSYRNILVDSAHSYAGVTTTPPHEIPRQPWSRSLPVGDGPAQSSARVLARIMELSREYLPTHPVNMARVAAGKRPANSAWIWGQGTRPGMPSFMSKYQQRGAMITAVDLLAGIAQLIGWDRLDVPGVTSYHDTSYVNQGSYTCDALDRYDIVCCHVEAPDEASHAGDAKTKLAAIEAIDELVVAPVLEKLQRDHAGDWRVMVLPDHYTLVNTRKHDDTPVPFVIAGAGVPPSGARAYTENDAHASDLFIPNGYDLMDFFLRPER